MGRENCAFRLNWHVGAIAMPTHVPLDGFNPILVWVEVCLAAFIDVRDRS